MLDIQLIREYPEKVKQTIRDKGLEERINPQVVDRILELDQKRRELISQVEEIRRERNELAKKLESKRADSDVQKGRELKEKLQDLQPELKRTEEAFQELMLMVPAVPHPDVPVGKDEKDNKVVREWREPRKEKWFKDHLKLGKELDLLDLDRGVKVSGFRGYFLKNEAVMMQLGLLRLGIDRLKEKGFVPMIPPVLNLARSLVNTGHFPWGRDDIYKTFNDREETDERFLAGTSEVPLVSYHQDEVLNQAELPKKYAGFSPCYRREAGSYGQDTRGIFRLHEFVKIEQVVIDVNDEEQSLTWLEDLVKLSEKMLQELELPYRVVLQCTGQMGEPQWKKYDIETYLPSRKGYGETHSASAMLDFQARRANVRYRVSDGSIKYVHMLNNTMIASPRILIALWENHQQKDGSIKIPAPLQPYLGFDHIRPTR